MHLKKLNQRPAIAAKFGVALIVLAALYSSLPMLIDSAQSLAPSLDFVSSYEKRFEGVRTLLPKRGVIGYVSDQSNLAFDYFLANYTFAPVMAETGDAPRLFIRNLTRDTAKSDPGSPEGQYTVRRTPDATVYDFGRGVSVVERDSK
jgi:hypothetical protein